MLVAHATPSSMANTPSGVRLPPMRSSSPTQPLRAPALASRFTSPPHRHHPYQPPRHSPPTIPTTTPSSSTITNTTNTTAHTTVKDDFSLSDEEMLLCDDDDADDGDAWSTCSHDAHRQRSSDSTAPGAGSTAHAAAADAGNGRSRRLLSLEQSKVLYKILDKTHFPSTQLREAAAAQLGVSARKVQVWFQNRRQVGKKRMMEAVTTIVATTPNIAPDALQQQLKAALNSKGDRCTDTEDERTRAWRRHTVRLALNPSEQEQHECHAALRELERGSREHPHHFHQQQQQREREMYGYAERTRVRGSRPAAALRISVPRSSHAAAGWADTRVLAASTPTYTGPGSATHLETLSARTPRTAGRAGPMPPLTPAAVRALVPPAIVTSQKESFSVPAYRPYPTPQRVRDEVYVQRRDRSATLPVQWDDAGRVRLRSSTDTVPRLPPLLPSLHSNTPPPRRERFTPYPSARYPPQPMLRPPASDAAGGRSRSISTPLHRPLRELRLSPTALSAPSRPTAARHIASPQRAISPRAHAKLSPPTPVRGRSATTELALTPSFRQQRERADERHSAHERGNEAESRASVLMDVRTLTNRS
ncbi:conserved hypothetical protein [Sporisorium reilianum SRZ2]|uniref:Homeobox domain-containing protein n=1 Tax=Sporisorium reilianum (strain SRZ2) TaxID=999809 RepID=E6ZQW9_SPORE|nr:conserved hypothetical protein [Sporisorium reilianum SRZ2]